MGGIGKEDPPVRSLESIRVGERVGMKVVMIRTRVDIQWQDGSLEQNVLSTEVRELFLNRDVRRWNVVYRPEKSELARVV